ncbi:MAG TPA: twin-arginine translocase TatA/TatE family subunit [Solirubrobacteraceae bacterium]|jgi:sec-independent protein translocase protein TatA
MFRNPGIDAIVILIIVLLILGPKRLPGIGKGLGSGMREFKEGITGEAKDDDKPELSEARTTPEATPSASEPAATPGSGTAGSERS